MEGADLAPGTQATLTQMRQRTARPQDLLPPEIVHFEPASLFSLDTEKIVVNFCFSWRGTAGGHSGVTNEHFLPLHDNPRDMHLFFRVAELLPRGQVPESVASMTALQMPGGGVRGIVAGDVVRRLVARTISQQLGKTVESTTAPFQYAHSTRAGCVKHALHALTNLDLESTIFSIDGISACDLISRRAMLSGFVQS